MRKIVLFVLLMVSFVQNVQAETIKTDFVCESSEILNHYTLNLLQGNPSLEFCMTGACRGVPEEDYQIISKQLLILPEEYIGIYAAEIMLAPGRYAYTMWSDPATKAQREAHYQKVIAQRKATEVKVQEIQEQENKQVEQKQKTLWNKTKKGLKFINDVMSY